MALCAVMWVCLKQMKHKHHRPTHFQRAHVILCWSLHANRADWLPRMKKRLGADCETTTRPGDQIFRLFGCL